MTMPKGFHPTEDPDWHHEHVDQGVIAHCQRKGCDSSWSVLCHSGHRRYCGEVCARAAKRERDRADKRRLRAQLARNEAAELAAIVTQRARTGLTTEQLQQVVADWHAFKQQQRKAKQRKRANRRLSAEQLYTKYKHGGDIKGVNRELSDVRTSSPSHAGAWKTPEVRHQDLQEPSRAAADQAPLPTGLDGGASHKGDPVKRNPDFIVSHRLTPTDYECCKDGTCVQHHQWERVKHLYRAPRHARIDEDH